MGRCEWPIDRVQGEDEVLDRDTGKAVVGERRQLEG